MNASLHEKVHYLRMMAAQAANQHRPHGGVEAVDELPPVWKRRNSEPFHHWYVAMLREILAHAARRDALAIALANTIADHLMAYVVYLQRLRNKHKNDDAFLRATAAKLLLETVVGTSVYAWSSNRRGYEVPVNWQNAFWALYDLGWLLGIVDNRYDVRGRVEDDAVRADGLEWLAHLFNRAAHHGKWRRG